MDYEFKKNKKVGTKYLESINYILTYVCEKNIPKFLEKKIC